MTAQAAASSSRAWRLGGLVVALGAQHADDLGDQLVAVDPLDRRLRALAAGLLVDPEVRVGQRGDLRQVGDADHLALGAQRAQPLAHRAGRVAADPGVDLVEDQRCPRPPPAPSPVSASMIRESSPPEAASRSGAGGDPRVGRDPELDRLRAARRRSRRDVARATPRASRPASPARSSSSATRCSSAAAALARASAELSPRAPPGRSSASASAASSSAARSSAFSSRSISARQRSAWASTASTLPPCLRFRRSSASRRSSTAARRAGSASIPSR